MTLSRRGFMWAVAALLGIAVPAALTWSVSRLAGQRIGLAYTPLSAIHGLAPRPAAPADPEPARSAAQRGSRHPKRNATPGGGATLALPTIAPPAVSPTATRSSPAPAAPAPAAPASAATTPSTSGNPTSGSGSRSSNGGDHHDDSGGGGSGIGGSGGGGSHRDD